MSAADILRIAVERGVNVDVYAGVIFGVESCGWKRFVQKLVVRMHEGLREQMATEDAVALLYRLMAAAQRAREAGGHVLAVEPAHVLRDPHLRAALVRDPRLLLASLLEAEASDGGAHRFPSRACSFGLEVLAGIDHDDTLTAEMCARPAGPAPRTPQERLQSISQLLRASRRLLCCGAERRRSTRGNSVRLAWIQHELAVLEWTTLVEPGERICAHEAWRRALRNHRDADSISATPLLEHMLLVIICSVIDSPDTAEESAVLYLRDSCFAVKRVFLNKVGWLLATLHVNEVSASAGADGAPGSILGELRRLAADVMGPAESALGQREKYEGAGDRGTHTRAAIVLGKMVRGCLSCPRCVLSPLATALADAVVRHLGASAGCAPDERAMRVWFLTSLLLPLARCVRLSVGAAKGTGAAMERDVELLRRIFRDACLTVFRLLCSESVRGGAGPVPRTTLDDDGAFGGSDEDRLVYVLHALGYLNWVWY